VIPSDRTVDLAGAEIGNGSVVSDARSIATGSGLSGGGDLTSDRTLSVDGSVVRTSGDQSVGGTKNFTGTLQVNGEEVVAGGGNEIEGMLTLSNTALGSSEKIVQFDVHRGFDIRRSATKGGASANLWLNAQVARNSWGVSYNDVEIVEFGTDGPTRFRKNVRFEEGANVTGSLTVDGDSVVSTSGDQIVGGTKNFTGTLQVDGTNVANLGVSSINSSQTTSTTTVTLSKEDGSSISTSFDNNEGPKGDDGADGADGSSNVDNSSDKYKTDFPVGHTILFRDDQNRDNNSVVFSNFISIWSVRYILDGNGSTNPSGTWRTRGYIELPNSVWHITILQRTA